MWYRLVSVWVFPPPNWVMRESTRERRFRFVQTVFSEDRAGVFGQGLGEICPGEELFRVLVVRWSPAVNDLVKGDGELVRVE